MVDLIIRKNSNYVEGSTNSLQRQFILQLRDHGPVETEYTNVAYVTKEVALEIIEATDNNAFFLYPEHHPHYPHRMETHEDGTEYPEPTRGFKSWIGIDWDATLVHYDEWQGPHKSGAPIEKMVERIKGFLAEGKTVKIITARVGNQNKAYADFCTRMIHAELEKMGLPKLEVTATKDFAMHSMYDDRCIPVVANTGMTWTEFAEHERSRTTHHEHEPE